MPIEGEKRAGEDPLALFTEQPASFEWIGPVGSFVTGPVLPEAAHARTVEELAGSVCGSGASLLDILQTLGVYLTNEDDVKRSRAVSFLSTVLTLSPELITTADHMHHLAEFFTSRLMDWVALRGALQGCDALLDRGLGSGRSDDMVVQDELRVELSEEDAVEMLRTISDGVYVRSLAAKDRSLVFTIVRKLVERVGVPALDAGVDLAELIVVSMDGEKDPGCLLDAFHAAQSVLRVFLSLETGVCGGSGGGEGDERAGGQGGVVTGLAPSVHLDMMRTAEDEMFDILSCYFPVSFEPREDSARKITRADLSGALEETLLLWPGFYASLLDMVEEKLGSIVKQAKFDSLRMIRGLCAVEKGREVVASERRRVWCMLRPEVMKETTASEAMGNSNGASMALDCIADCLRVAGMEKEVLGDVVIDDCMACLRGGPETSETSEDVFSRQIDLVRSVSSIFRACALSGGHVWEEALTTHAGEILQAGSGFQPSAHACLSVILLHCLMSGVGCADVTDSKSRRGNGKEVDSVIQRIQEVGVSFADDLSSVDPHEDMLDALPWRIDSASPLKTASTMVAAKASLCEALACNEQFVDSWTQDSIRSLVHDLIRVILCDHEALASNARGKLERICASGAGARFGAWRTALDVLLEHLGSPATNRNVSYRIFLFFAAACRADPSLRNVVIHEACSRSGSLADLARGLVTLEDEFAANVGELPATTEEIQALQTILSRAAARGQDDLVDASDRESIARAAFYICRRMKPRDQSRIVPLKDVTLFNECLFGCIVGMHPEVIQEHADLLGRLVNDLISSSKHGVADHLASTAIACTANKTSDNRDRAVVDAVNALIMASRWDVVEEVLHALAMQAGSVLDEVLDKIILARKYGALRYLVSSQSSRSFCATWISTESHARVAFLWQQKAYTKAKDRILHAFAHHANELQTADGTKPTESTDTTESVAETMVHLISGLPPALVRTDKRFVSQQLSRFLVTGCVSRNLMDDPNLEHILQVIHGNGLIALPELLDQLGGVVRALLNITLHGYHAGSRSIAIACLIQIAQEVPYQKIHPYRRDIVKAVTAACDDNKRAVRAAAVTCRGLYGL